MSRLKILDTSEYRELAKEVTKTHFVSRIEMSETLEEAEEKTQEAHDFMASAESLIFDELLKRDLFWINKIYWQTASVEIKKGDKRDNFEIDDFCGWLKNKIEESDEVVRVYESKDFVTSKTKLFIRKQNDFVAVAEFCKQSRF